MRLGGLAGEGAGRADVDKCTKRHGSAQSGQRPLRRSDGHSLRSSAMTALRDEADFTVSALSEYLLTMKEKLSPDLIWSLRALAQNASVQRELYPDFVVVADELVLDYYDALTKYKEKSQFQHADLEVLDAHIASKSGILEFWTDEALDRSAFWNVIRQQAKQALKARDLSMFAPHASTSTYVSEHEVWTSGRNTEEPVNDTQGSILSRFFSRFR